MKKVFFALMMGLAVAACTTVEYDDTAIKEQIADLDGRLSKVEEDLATLELNVEALRTLANALKEGDKVQLIGFGTFEAKVTGEREGRNPRTGETIKIAACKKPAFAASKALKDQIN